MKILEVSRYKEKFPGHHQSPFVTEQGEAIRALGHEVEYFLLQGNYFKQYFALKKKIREFKPDIVHAHYGLSAIVAELQCTAPVVTTFHNGETHTWYVNFVSSLFSKLAKHVIYVAPHIRQKLYFKAKNYSIIPCGISLEECFLMDKAEARMELGWKPDKKYILFGGSFDDLRKGFPLLKDAVETLKREDIEFAEMWKLSRRECMLMMNAADMFALPTKNEGSPQALKEAMACNCPIVATDVADIKYMLGDVPGHYILANKRGTQADWVGDEHSVEELADMVEKALAFNSRTKGREQIIKIGYTNELVAKRIINIYKEILKK